MLPCCSLLRRASSFDCGLCHIRGSHCVDQRRVQYQESPVVPGDQSLAIRSPSIKSGKARRFPYSRSASSVEATKDDVVYVVLNPCDSKPVCLCAIKGCVLTIPGWSPNKRLDGGGGRGGSQKNGVCRGR